ncbi:MULTISPECIES: hypothetical protein [unclassified Spirillospora]|uniref:hypothetical protein n=1 Tax=unclassified Spirillospora TaxID=2642701 RepID=UPI0037158B36
MKPQERVPPLRSPPRRPGHRWHHLKRVRVRHCGIQQPQQQTIIKPPKRHIGTHASILSFTSRRADVSFRWIPLRGVGGMAFLLGLGLLIG